MSGTEAQTLYLKSNFTKRVWYERMARHRVSYTGLRNVTVRFSRGIKLSLEWRRYDAFQMAGHDDIVTDIAVPPAIISYLCTISIRPFSATIPRWVCVIVVKLGFTDLRELDILPCKLYAVRTRCKNVAENHDQMYLRGFCFLREEEGARGRNVG